MSRSPSLDLLADLVAHDTTSAGSNRGLIDYIADRLSTAGIQPNILPAHDGKASLVATIGPPVTGGTLLSGHSDVVPVAGQAWSSDPFCLDIRDGRAFGRGSADMKGFIACALALFERIDPRRLRSPIHLAVTFDEEVGCLGAPLLIEQLASFGIAPTAVFVGEPTSMRVVNAHKGLTICCSEVTGKEAHSSLQHLGASAVDLAGRLIEALKSIEAQYRTERDPHFTPDYTSISVNRIAGGTAANILAGRCEFEWDVRCLPQVSSAEILAAFADASRTIMDPVRAEFPQVGLETKILADAPGLRAEPDGAAEALALRLSGSNQTETAPYAAEAGQYQHAGYSTVIIGPGSIEEAHKADEFISLDQMTLCDQFLDRLAEYSS